LLNYTVEGAQGRSNDPREEVRTANNEQRGRERDQTTPNTSNARKRLRMMSSCLQNDVEAPITPTTPSQSFIPETNLQNPDVTVSYLQSIELYCYVISQVLVDYITHVRKFNIYNATRCYQENVQERL